MNTKDDASIVLINEDGDEELFFVQEQTRVNGTTYLLVATSNDDEEADAFILKDTSTDGDEMANYVMVDDDIEFDAIADVFRQMMEDVDLQ